MEITKEVIEYAGNFCKILLENHSESINAAYLDADDGLTVSLKLTFVPKGSGVRVKTDINFVTERVKESISQTVMLNQMQLPMYETANG